jgi:hypothetical protein
MVGVAFGGGERIAKPPKEISTRKWKDGSAG